VTEPELFTAGVLVVVQRSKLFSERAEYDLHTPDGSPVGSVHERTGSGKWFLGGLATLTYDVVDPGGRQLLQLTRPGTWGRSRFEVFYGSGARLGAVSQDNLMFAPRFTLQTAAGERLRLRGGAWMSHEWQIVDAADTQLGRVTKRFGGLAEMFTSTDRYVIELQPGLTGMARHLAVAATVCLDVVRDLKRRSDAGSG
jgi:hypothetical protein